jgi:hypothetical protein
MANLRQIKKDIDYVVSEVVYDCYMAIYFHPAKKDEIVGIITDAADLRNNLFEMVNNPAEKHNRSLVRKHFAFIRNEAANRIEGLFEKLGNVVNA